MVPTLKPVARPLALGEQVYHTLRGHLRNGQIVAGQPLQEVQLAEQLGVSRTPVQRNGMFAGNDWSGLGTGVFRAERRPGC